MVNRNVEEYYINVNPLQTGGRTSSSVRKAANRYIDGYSICDSCKGALHLIEKPPLCELTKELAEFLGMDEARITLGAREGKFIVMHTLLQPGDPIVVDSNSHYTTYVAAERAGAKVYEVPNTGYPEFEIKPEAYLDTIKKIRPKLILLTHVDGDYGNLTPAMEVGKICKEQAIPFLINAAYTAGRMKINGKELGADFIVASGHKGFATSGPIGILATTRKWADELFRKSERFEVKEIELLGCTARGASIASLLAALPEVKNRVNNWDEEVKKARWFVEKMESLGEIKQLGIKPTLHDLIRLETPLFFKIGERHRKRGYFLSEELKRRGIVGIKLGQTKWFKLSTYGFTWDQLKYLCNTFEEITKENK